MSSHDTSGMSLPIMQGPAEHKDPVCGMTVVPEKTAGKVEHAGKTYYFCSKGCAERFSQEPEKFLAASGAGGMKHSPAPGEHGAVEHAGPAALRASPDAKNI